MKLKILVFITIMAMSGIAPANDRYPHQISLQLFRSDCELPDRPSQIRCETFLLGVVDTINALSVLGELEKNYFCIPDEVSEAGLRKVFVDYITTQSGVDPLASAASYVIRAIDEAFPCK
jgi:hypothetical protein